ncbi:MAG: hypothetical protein ACERKD_22555 [Prolixibacteraceae bacterium]
MDQIRYFHQPTISESLGNGWFTMKKYFLWLLLAIIVGGLFQGGPRYTFSGKDFSKGDWSWASNVFSYNAPDHFFMAGWILMAILFGLAIMILISPVFTFGSTMMFIQAARDQQPEPRWLIRGFQNNYFNIVLANLLKFAIVAMSFVALIIPGIIVACRLAFVANLVMDKGLDPIRAIEESWRMTKGHGWTIFGLALMAIPIFILGLICLIVGVFPALIWISASFASLYQSILTLRDSETAELIYEI